MEKEEIFYQAKASYIGESNYGTKKRKTVLSPKFKTIEQLNDWIINNKRKKIVFGMGDIDFPQMSSCKIIETKAIIKEYEIDLKSVKFMFNED